MSTVERLAIGEVRLARLLDSASARHGWLVILDRPRAIDRYIDYFGGPVRRPGTPSGRHVIAEPQSGGMAAEAVGGR